MSPVVREVRSLVGLWSWWLCFPLVFLVTLLESLALHRRQQIGTAIGAVLLAGLCVYTVDLIRFAF